MKSGNPFDRFGRGFEDRLRKIIARRGCGPVQPKGEIPPTYSINTYRPVAVTELKPRGERMVAGRLSVDAGGGGA